MNEDRATGIRTTSVLMTAEMRMKVREAAVKTFGTKGISTWHNRAIADFLSQPDWFGLVGYAEGSEKFNGRYSVRLFPTTQDAIAEAVQAVRRVNPMEEGVHSQIVRAAFRRALAKGVSRQSLETVEADGTPTVVHAETPLVFNTPKLRTKRSKEAGTR
ncbi:hypothetical protein [Luteimonas sp. MHLX1A]|uniref:hypothetical protein n=1 Tax=Alterluteimonas muca TaxID=2878684 RepID=UPI001E39FE74|nr:hypothetical protein [Luteimonas sp. MHLX1A]MCD9046747.1 hypothetical protein [Luteimonas sp. MHLX1A]